MVFYYVYQDIGAYNALKLLKYSILHLNSARERFGRQDVKIHVDYIRTLGKNPTHESASFFSDFVDEFAIYMYDHKDITLNRGWPMNSQTAYLNQADKYPDDQVIYVHPSMMFIGIPDINPKDFVFWRSESSWINVPWGFATEQDAEKFFKAHTKGTSDMYDIHNCDFLHVPKENVPEFRERVPKMIKYCMDMYADTFAYQCSCTIAASIACSVVAQEIAEESGASIKKMHMHDANVIRYATEVESDIAGALRLFFD